MSTTQTDAMSDAVSGSDFAFASAEPGDSAFGIARGSRETFVVVDQSEGVRESLEETVTFAESDFRIAVRECDIPDHAHVDEVRGRETVFHEGRLIGHDIHGCDTGRTEAYSGTECADRCVGIHFACVLEINSGSDLGGTIDSYRVHESSRRSGDPVGSRQCRSGSRGEDCCTTGAHVNEVSGSPAAACLPSEWPGTSLGPHSRRGRDRSRLQIMSSVSSSLDSSRRRQIVELGLPDLRGARPIWSGI